MITVQKVRGGRNFSWREIIPAPDARALTEKQWEAFLWRLLSTKN